MEAWCRLVWRRPEAIQALRMTASSLAAFALATLLHLPQGFWAVITALIVTQANVGGSLKAAFDRFVGWVRALVAKGPLQTVAEALLAAWQAVSSQVAILTRRLLGLARQDQAVKRLMTTPGVGTIGALT
mgnify:CR=1 FL=1